MEDMITRKFPSVHYTSRRGSIVIGIVQTAMTVVFLVSFTMTAFNINGMQNNVEDLITDESKRAVAVAAIGIHVVMLLCCLSLIYGAYKRQALFIMPWIAFYFFIILMYVIGTIGWCLYHIKHDNYIYFTFGIIIGLHFLMTGVIIVSVVLAAFSEISCREISPSVGIL